MSANRAMQRLMGPQSTQTTASTALVATAQPVATFTAAVGGSAETMPTATYTGGVQIISLLGSELQSCTTSTMQATSTAPPVTTAPPVITAQAVTTY